MTKIPTTQKTKNKQKKYATKKRCKFIFLALERKISVRANRDELVQKGILLPDSNISTIPEPGNYPIFANSLSLL